jgi:hypothetical protein
MHGAVVADIGLAAGRVLFGDEVFDVRLLGVPGAMWPYCQS